MSASVEGTGIRYDLPSSAVLDRRAQQADKPGEHLWVVLATWHISDPERPGAEFLDQENLILVTGVGCFKCEKEYSRQLAKQRCTGSLELQ